jgi:hypothetical protein
MGLPGWMPGRPGGDPQRLTEMADAWGAVDTALQAAERQLIPQAEDISPWWRGQAAGAYTAAWYDYSAGLAPLHQQLQAVAATLQVASFAIWSAQMQYDQAVEEVMAGAAVLTGAAFFTFGLSEAGEAGILASASATITELLASLAEALAEIAASIGEALAAMARIAAQLLLPLGGGAGTGGGMALALAGGGTLTVTTTTAGTGLAVSGTVVAAGAVAIDALLARALGGGGGHLSAGGGGSGGEVNPGDQVPRKYEADANSLNHFASKHGGAFGLPQTTPTAAGRAAISDYVRDWIMDPAHEQIVGTYQRQAAIIYLDPGTGQVMFTYPDGQFWSGFLLGKAQLTSLLTTGGFA